MSSKSISAKSLPDRAIKNDQRGDRLALTQSDQPGLMQQWIGEGMPKFLASLNLRPAAESSIAGKEVEVIVAPPDHIVKNGQRVDYEVSPPVKGYVVVNELTNEIVGSATRKADAVKLQRMVFFENNSAKDNVWVPFKVCPAERAMVEDFHAHTWAYNLVRHRGDYEHMVVQYMPELIRKPRY